MNQFTTLIEESLHFELDHNINNKEHMKPQLQEIIIEEPIEEEKANKCEFMKNLIKMQGFFRMKKNQKLFKQMKKKLKNRGYIIDELIRTEESFKKSLFLVQEKCAIPLKNQKILSKEELSGLFSNLESIASFSKSFHIALYEKFNYNFEISKTKLGETVLLLLPFFKLYFEYCHNFPNSMTLLTILRKKNAKFADFLKDIELQEDFGFQDLNSQLIKPIQRLPKYVLLFKDLLKNTEINHPDYGNIQLCLKQFSVLNGENDKKLLQKVKIFELQEKYGSSLSFSIPDSQREFLEEFSLVMLTDKTTLIVIVYFLNDLMLVTEQSSYFEPKLIKYLTFDYNSYVKDLPNSRYFKYCISIFGKEGGLTFVFKEKTEKYKIIEFLNIRIFNEINTKIKSKISGFSYFGFGDYMRNKQIVTEVIGTVTRGLDHIKPYTIYIIQVRLVEIQYRVFLRYKELLNLEAYLLGLGMNNIAKLPPKHFWTEQKPRTIEARKLHVESFLRSVLSNEAVVQNKENKEKVLEKLGLPENFYQIETFTQEIKQKNKDFLLNPDDPISLKLNKRKCAYKSYLEMFKNSKRVLSLNEGLKKGGPFKKIEVIFSNNERLSIEISKNTKTFEVCKELAEAAGLSSWLDFKLCLVSSSMDEIIIDDEEYLYRALDIKIDEKDNNPSKLKEKKTASMLKEKSLSMGKEKNLDKNSLIYAEILESTEKKPIENHENNEKKEEKSLKTWFQEAKAQVINFIEGLLEKNLYCNSQLMFKKAFYLNSELEEIDYKTDLVRLDLMIHQAFAEISQNRLSLSLMDYCLFASLTVYMKYGAIYSISSLEIEELFKKAIFNNAIPALILYKKNREFWFENVSWYWKIFSDEIERIIQKNKDFNAKIAEKTLESLVKGKQCDLQKKTVDGSIIAKFVFLKCLFRTALYGNHRFFGSLVTKDETNVNLTKIRTVWLAVSFQNLRFLDDKTSKEFNRISFDDLDVLVATAANLEINLKNDKFLFYTMKGFEIKEIVEVYRRMKKVIGGLGKKKKAKRGKEEDRKFRKSGFS